MNHLRFKKIRLLGFKDYGEFFINPLQTAVQGQLAVRTLPFQRMSYQIACPVIKFIHLDARGGSKLKFTLLKHKHDHAEYMTTFFTQFEHLWTCKKIVGLSQISAYLFANANIFCIEAGTSTFHQNELSRYAYVFLASPGRDEDGTLNWVQQSTITLQGRERYVDFMHLLKRGYVRVVE